MDRINRICRHPLWRECLQKIEELEKDRPFCHHDLPHLMDVARLAYIESLEKHLPVPREQIYAAALLHDIGRHRQYLEGIPHDVAGAELAAVILADCGFDPEEQREILRAVGAHRDPRTRAADDLAGLLYRADKASRLCLFCQAEPDCNWSREKKNLELKR